MRTTATTRPPASPPEKSSEPQNPPTFDWEEAELSGALKGAEMARQRLLARGINPKTRKPIKAK